MSLTFRMNKTYLTSDVSSAEPEVTFNRFVRGGMILKLAPFVTFHTDF